MKNLLPPIIFISLITSFAQADFNGTWLGEGTLRYVTGQTEKCQLTIAIEQTVDTFFVTKSLFKCENMKIENKNPQPLKIQNGEIWRDGTRLGTITENLIHTQLSSPDGRKQEYKLQLPTPQKMNYEDTVEWTLTFKTSMTGTLQRQQESPQKPSSLATQRHF